jgi:hypothetical protein
MIDPGGRAEAIEASLDLTELEKAMPEIDPGADILRPLPKMAPKIFGGGFVFANLLMRSCHPGKGIGGVWQNLKCPREGALGFRAVSPPQKYQAELK